MYEVTYHHAPIPDTVNEDCVHCGRRLASTEIYGVRTRLNALTVLAGIRRHAPSSGQHLPQRHSPVS
jgi:hypothetical protein